MSQQWGDPNSPGSQASNPGGQQFGSPPMYGGMQQNPMGLLAIGEKRDPIMAIVWLFLTCGIYGIYWMITYGNEVKNALGRHDLNPVMDWVIGLFTFGIYSIYCFGYKYPKLLVDMQIRAGLPPNDISTTTLIVWLFFAPVSVYLIQAELNRIWDAALQRR